MYQPKKIVDYKSQIRKVVGDQLPDDFCVIKADTPIHVVKLHYCFKYPKSMSKKRREASDIVYKVTKPDLHDNLNKALFDALEGIVWERDQNVVAIDDMKKYYAEADAILLEIIC